VRLETIPLTGLSPGEYELRLAVEDEASGHTQELREPFVVRRPSHPDPAVYLELLHAFQAGEIVRAASGVMEWRPKDLEKLAASLPTGDGALSRAALLLHTALALRLWSNNRGPEADEQIAICRAVLAQDSPPELHRDWLLALGYFQLALGQPDRVLKALPFFEECARLFPDAAEAWLRAGMCYESAAFPDGFDFGRLPEHEAAERAEGCYRRAVQLDPRLAEARIRLGRVLSSTGKLDEAERELAAGVAASSEGGLTALAQVFWGGVRDARGDVAGAVSHYQAAHAADLGCETAVLALSEALYRLGRRRRAAETLSSTVSAVPSTEISAWQAYHLGFLRRNGLLNELLQAPPEAASLAAGPELSGAP
jgi:tetratricopeptide (TPR) repeat protein